LSRRHNRDPHRLEFGARCGGEIFRSASVCEELRRLPGWLIAGILAAASLNSSTGVENRSAEETGMGRQGTASVDASRSQAANHCSPHASATVQTARQKQEPEPAVTGFPVTQPVAPWCVEAAFVLRREPAAALRSIHRHIRAPPTCLT